MNKKFTEVLSVRASGHVKRWHVVPTIGEQKVSEHSGQAVSLLLLLHPGPSVNLIKGMLWHDTSERIVGDMPATGKRAKLELGQLYEHTEMMVAQELHPSVCVLMTPDENRWLRACDVLELYLHAQDEINLGNRHFEVIKGRAVTYLRASPETPTEVLDFLSWHVESQQTGSFA